MFFLILRAEKCSAAALSKHVDNPPFLLVHSVFSSLMIFSVCIAVCSLRVSYLVY